MLFMAVIVPWSILLPILIGILKYKILPQSLKLILGYLIFTAIVNAISIILARVFHVNNMPVTHFYTLVEFVIIVFWYRNVLEVSKKSSPFNLLIILFSLLCFINVFFFQSIFSYNSYTRSLEAIICIFFGLNYFAKIALEENKKNKSVLAINCGIFLYFSGAFILFIFSNLLISNLAKSDFLVVWNIHATLVLLMYTLFSIGFILCKK